MQKLIAICGMSGAGKTEVTQYFEDHNFVRIHFGSTEETLRRYGEATEALERKVRNEIRQEHGMAAMAVIALDKIRYLLKTSQNVIIDNMYSWSEYKLLKQQFPSNFFTIAVHAKPEIRYTRLGSRPERPRDRTTAISRDYSEIEEIEKGGPIAMADFNIINETTIEFLHEQLTQVLAKIKQ